MKLELAEGPDGKSGDHGIEMMFIGYPANRESDSVLMWDPITNGVLITRDVIWMKQMYFTQPKMQSWMSNLYHLTPMLKMLRM